MSGKGDDAFVRWQERTIQQLGFVNNLLTGLSTGLLVFQTQLAFDDKTTLNQSAKWLLIASAICVFASLMLGCWVAWNRLNSFRNTAKIVRCRENSENETLDVLRKLTDHIDTRTWLLLRLQALLFGLGSFLLLIVAVMKYLQ